MSQCVSRDCCIGEHQPHSTKAAVDFTELYYRHLFSRRTCSSTDRRRINRHDVVCTEKLLLLSFSRLYQDMTSRSSKNNCINH
mmetsp:Transcript_8205/g.12828  ORF Transcript_8205/g.12828 Transcript_8205/m.12828 type:complete len:83 (-) Transcript_8205:51-299(-)